MSGLMGDQTAIQWADSTWNPVTGCDRVSPGCAHCYALDLAPRLRRFAEARRNAAVAGCEPRPDKWLTVRDGGPSSGPAFGVTLHPGVLDQPLRWRKPRRIFVNSMSDLFHEQIPDGFIAEVFARMALAPHHTFQVLTKRPERMRRLLGTAWFQGEVDDAIGERAPGSLAPCWPLPNCWVGVSIENRRFVHRADLLRQTPAAMRFISAEPLLGPLLWDSTRLVSECDEWGREMPPDREACWADGTWSPELDLIGIDWLIIGGESGSGFRPIREEWVRDLRDACLRDHNDLIGPRSGGRFPLWDLHGTAFFVKQWGGRTPKSGGRLLDGRTWDEMPSMTTNQTGDRR